MTELLPYLPDYWRDQFENRHIHKLAFNLTSYPPNSPLTARPTGARLRGSPAAILK
jgi:uncharacterized protein